LFPSDEHLWAEGLRSYCTVPIILQGTSFGALSVASRRPRQYSSADADFLQEVANQLALAVANMKAYEEIESLRKRLQVENSRLREEIREAEIQVVVAESAASMGRFAATLAHELNSPVGALKSALASTLRLAEAKATFSPRKLEEIREVEAALSRTLLDSAARLEEIVRRMQRFTNLDRAERVPVDLNRLLRDVVAFSKAEIGARPLELALEPLPSLELRPQAMSAAFSSLIQNALAATSGGTRIRLATRDWGSTVEVIVEDDGDPLSPAEIDTLFEPVFKVEGKRMASGNWSLFSARQMLRAEGGNIDVEGPPSGGKRFRVTLPVSREKLPAAGRLPGNAR
jgi:signal transduction histidine kinase